jgi:hypothetical protein
MVTATEAGLSAVAPYLMPDYTADTFQPYVGQVFTFEAVHQSVVIGLKLLQVSRRPGGKAAGFRESFSLLFTLSSGEPSIGGLYRIAHGDFAPCEWFVSRVFVPGADPSVPHYEAVFG